MSQAGPDGLLSLPLARRGGLTGLWDALHAEWTKLRTVTGPAWALIAAVAATVTVSAAASAAVRCPSGTACPVDTAKLSLTGIQVGQVVVAILAILVISGEYSTGMVRTTLTAGSSAPGTGSGRRSAPTPPPPPSTGRSLSAARSARRAPRGRSSPPPTTSFHCRRKRQE